MDGSFDSTTWTALAITLTVVGAVLSFLAYRRRGAAAGLRGLALTLLPVAALLTGTLRLLVAIGEDVAAWATRLVLSPVVWSGIGVAGLAVVLWLVAGAMTARGVGVSGKAAERAVRKGERLRGRQQADPAVGAAPAPRRGRAAPARGESDGSDGDMDEVEAILRKHGI